MITAIEALRREHRKENLMLIIDDQDAQFIMIAWTILHPDFADFPVDESAAAKKVWADAWESTLQNVDIKALASLANVPERTALESFHRLRTANLIYPDGTISDDAMTIIRAEVGTRLTQLAKGATRS